MAIQLVSHLLERLDRALSPLSESDMQPLGVLNKLSSGGSGSSDACSETSERNGFSLEDQSEQRSKRTSRNHQEQSHGYNVATKVLEIMHQRHGNLQHLIKVIKSTINESNIL